MASKLKLSLQGEFDASATMTSRSLAVTVYCSKVLQEHSLITVQERSLITCHEDTLTTFQEDTLIQAFPSGLTTFQRRGLHFDPLEGGQVFTWQVNPAAPLV